MKQKIVVQVHMSCEKCRIKALKIAAGFAGVDYVAIEGNDKDKVVVIGNEVDAVNLAKCLKKVGNGYIVSVEEVKPKDKEKEKVKEKEKKEDEAKPWYSYGHPYNYCYEYPNQWVYILP